MKRVLVQTAENIHSYRANITIAILAACFLCAVFYAVNLYSLISHTVAIREADKAIARISSEISGLDAEYLKLTSAITPDTLAQHGFSAGQVTYIKRSQTTASIITAPALARGHEL